jgi:hypothetical protein
VVAADRQAVIQGGEVDDVAQHHRTFSRDTLWADFSLTTFYDGQASLRRSPAARPPWKT